MYTSKRSRIRLQLELLEDRVMLAASSIANFDAPGLIDIDAILVAHLDNDPFCPRQVSFEIPGTVGVQVTATENGGSIDFTVDVLDSSSLTGDLRGLFFHYDELKLGSLQVTGGDGLITGVQIAANAVIDLGNGNNMSGAASPFDLGIAFGTQGIGKGDDISDPVHFTLTNEAQDLTVDDFAYLQFGARVTSIGDPAAPNKRKDSDKIVVIAPAAPKAHDDVVNIFEDGASGLDDPRRSPTAVLFNVLANDIADAPLSVIAFHDGPSHGTVAIAPNGDVLYTPHADYAGTDSFVYCVSDRPGSQDSATVTVNIEAVADVPEISVQVSPGATVYEIDLHVTAAATDIDGSEYIDRFEFAGLPDGVVVLGAPGGVNDVPGTPGMAAGNFTLVLQPGRSYDFELAVKVYSKELSNGDEEVATQTIDVVLEYKTTSGGLNFEARGQSIWDNGDEFMFALDEFVGIDFGFEETLDLGILFARAEATLKAGLDVDILFKGGRVDANVPIDVTFNTIYNKTTEVLVIEPSSRVATGGGFTTEGPTGHAKIDFIFKYGIGAAVGLDLPIFGEITVFGFNPRDDRSENLIDLDSADLAVEHDFGYGLNGGMAWPNLTTTGVQSSTDRNRFLSSDQSNNFLHLNADIDQVLAEIFLGGVNPFDIHIPFDLGVVDGSIDIELVDVDLFGGLNFLQDFSMLVTGMMGTLTFENNQTLNFNFNQGIPPLVDAKSYDIDGDGMVEFVVTLTPVVSLANRTNVTFNVGYNFDLLKGQLTYDAGIAGSGTESFGPLLDLGGSLDIAAVNIYENNFPLNFQQQSMQFFAGATLPATDSEVSLTVAESALTLLIDPLYSAHYASSIDDNQVVDLLVDPQPSIGASEPLFAAAPAIARALASTSPQHTTTTDSQPQQPRLTTGRTNNDLLIRVVDSAFEYLGADRMTLDDDFTSLAVELYDGFNRSTSINSRDHLFAALVDDFDVAESF